MRSLVIALSMAALVTTAGCARKAPLASTGDPQNAGTSAAVDDGELVELPQLQADLVARAGSDTIYFATDDDKLDAADRAVLSAQGEWLKQHPNVRASIEGHADERGTREYNLALGERRAEASRQFLISMGVRSDRLLATSWGKERPVAVGSTESAWSQNRRSVTVIIR